jgi:hypothetical protein
VSTLAAEQPRGRLVEVVLSKNGFTPADKGEPILIENQFILAGR